MAGCLGHLFAHLYPLFAQDEKSQGAGANTRARSGLLISHLTATPNAFRRKNTAAQQKYYCAATFLCYKNQRTHKVGDEHFRYRTPACPSGTFGPTARSPCQNLASGNRHFRIGPQCCLDLFPRVRIREISTACNLVIAGKSVITTFGIASPDQPSDHEH
jgi:hypothetical protein